MRILPHLQIIAFFTKIGNLIFQCIASIISFFLVRKNDKAYNFKPLLSFGSIIGFIAVNDILPDWQGFWGTKNVVEDNTSHAVTLSRVCKAFDNVSVAEKIALGYKDKVRSFVQGWWEADNTLLTTTFDQYQGGVYGGELYHAIDEFRVWNAKQIAYLLRYDTCSPEMVSIDKIVNKRDSIINKLPLTIGQYIKFYIEVRLLGKGVPLGKEKAPPSDKEEAQDKSNQ